MLSGIVTAILLVLFLIGSVWAFSPRRKRDFEAAARLPLNDDPPFAAAQSAMQQEESIR
jgi:cytochrome c oxidase cbb3-type subunit IV